MNISKLKVYSTYAQGAAHYFAGNGSAPNQIRRVIYEVTYRCNLRCSFCYFWGTENREKNLKMLRKDDELTYNEIQGILIPQMKEMNTQGITMTGGEVFVRQDINDVLRLFNEEGFQQTILSNLTVCDDKKIESIVNHVNKIIVSIDGHTPELHDQIRGVKGAFKRSTDTMKKIIDIKSPNLTTAINCVITENNMHNLSGVVDVARATDVDGIAFQFLDWQTDDSKASTGFMKDQESNIHSVTKASNDTGVDASIVFDQLQKARDKADAYGIKFHTFPMPMPEHQNQVEKWHTDHNYSYTKRCMAPFIQVRVNAYGDVLPCPLEIFMGNIRREPLRDIWNNTKFKALRRGLRNQLTERCHKCSKLTGMYNKHITTIRR